MKAFKRHGIAWFLDDQGLGEAVADLREPQDSRRSYGVITWGDKRIFEKYFLEKGVWAFMRNKIDPRGAREFRTGKALLGLGIATPQAFGYGLGRKGSFVLQEFVDGVPLWSPISDSARRPELLERLAILLVRLREHGVLHNDLHLGNVMLKDDQLLVIDLHKAKIKGRRFSPSDEAKNLCHVLNSFYRELTEKEKGDFFKRYGRPEIRPAVEERLLKEEAGWIERKKARAFSTTSKLKRAARRVYIKGTEGTGEGAFVNCLKHDRKVRVERHTDHIRKVYRNSRRLKKAWRNHVAIEYLGMPVVPKPFYVQWGGLFSKGFIAMEDFGDRGEELDRFLDRHYDSLNPGRVHRFIDSLSRFVDMLIKKGVWHKDWKACNIFTLENDFRLLDVEDVIFRRPSEGDLGRLFFQLHLSVPARIAFSHRARFFLKMAGKLGFGRSEKKEIVAEVMRASAGEAIVYEGINGLKKEAWTEIPRWHHR